MESRMAWTEDSSGRQNWIICQELFRNETINFKISKLSNPQWDRNSFTDLIEQLIDCNNSKILLKSEITCPGIISLINSSLIRLPRVHFHRLISWDIGPDVTEWTRMNPQVRLWLVRGSSASDSGSMRLWAIDRTAADTSPGTARAHCARTDESAME